jgi:tetratricopeptide (TPR) repeat protein
MGLFCDVVCVFAIKIVYPNRMTIRSSHIATLLILQLCFFSLLSGSDKKLIDSLQIELNRSQVDTIRVTLMAQLAQELSFSYPDSAIVLSREGIAFADKIMFSKGRAACLASLGNALFTQSKYKDAWIAFTEVLQISERIHDNKRMAYALLSIGNIYYYQNDKVLALENYQRCLSIGELAQDLATCASAYINVGCIHIDQNKYDEGIECLKKASKYFEQCHDKKGLCYSYRNLGLGYLMQGKSTSAIDYLNKSLLYAEELQNKEMISGCLQSLSDIYRAIGNTRKSIEYGKRALSLALEIHDLPYVKGAARTLYECYTQRGEFKVALDFYKMASIANDSILYSEKGKELKNLQHQYEIEKKEKEIELLEQKSKNQQLFTALFATALFLSLLLVVTIYWNLKKEKKAKLLITKQRDEILDKNEKLRLLNDEREKLIDELKIALENVKTLGGLLPICASCKKIRNDSGYWQAVEGYIMEHSEAKFSHGVCPECFEKLYPGYAERIRAKSGRPMGDTSS